MAEQYRGTGRRKTSIAQVHITQGSGRLTISRKDIDKYLDLETLKMVTKTPLEVTDLEGSLDVIVKAIGSGFTSQAGAIRRGLSRALVGMGEELRPALEKTGSLTRGPRMRERKKYGLKKVRKAPQFSKRQDAKLRFSEASFIHEFRG